jgi:hypothetical protein
MSLRVPDETVPSPRSCAAVSSTSIFEPNFNGLGESLDDDWKTQLGTGHLTQCAARFICDGRLRIYTDGFFEFGASVSEVVQFLIS